MRQVIGGNGQDNTVATQAYLAANHRLIIRHLYLIGDVEDPRALWLTDHEAPVLWSPWGTFQPAVIKRGGVTTKVGLEVQKLAITWSPGNRTSTVNTSTASPQQLARLHVYDNWPVRIWKVFLAAPGDANTLGACDWFGGRIDTATVDRGAIEFSASSNLSVVTQKVPSTVIEVTNTLASTAAVTVPPGDASVPVFSVVTGSNETQIIADCLSPTAGKIYSGDFFAGGYMVFLSGAGATLAGAWSAIGGNGAYVDGSGNHHSSFSIYSPLPWPPTPGADTFYVSPAPPINLGDENYFGFPYVPAPQTAV